MKYSAVLFSALLFTATTFAGLLPGGSNTGGDLLPGGSGSGGNVLPGGSSGGGNVLPDGSSGGGNVLPSSGSKSGGSDMFVSATVLTGDSAQDIANNSKATLEAGEPVHGGSSGVVGGKSLWWKWRATITGTLVVSTAGSSIDTLVGIYTGDSVDSLVRLGADNDSGANATSLLTIPVVTGLTYYIAVDGYNGEGGDIILQLAAAPYPTTVDGRPYNDDFENAEILSGSYTTSVGYTDDATAGTNDYFGSSFSDNRSIWWAWTAPASGSVTMSTDGSSFRTFLAVMADPDGLGDRWVASASDLTNNAAKVTFQVVKGVTYYITVDGSVIYLNNGGTSRGTAFISIDLVPTTTVTINKVEVTRPANDQFEFRTGVKSNSYSQSATNKNATAAVDEDLHGGSNSTSTVWWTWTAPKVGKLTLTATSSDTTDTVKPVIAAYTGSTIGSLTPIGSATDVNGVTKLFFNVQPGIVYQIAVCGGVVDDSGPFNFTLEYSDGSPAFAAQPVSINALSGSSVVFSAPATDATLNPYIYQWQRLVGKTWVNIVSDATYTAGPTIPTLNVNNVTLGNSGSQFRCLLYNVLGVATSSVATLTVVPNPPTALSASFNTIKVGTLVNTTVAVVNPNFAVKYYALGLPKGLKINANTGQITGTLTAAAGSYTVTYWTQSGKLKSSVLTTIIVVPPYPAALTGDFEALLTDGSDIPVGKLQVTIGSTGLYTGKLTTGAAAVNVLKGSLVVAANDLSATSTLAIKRKGFPNSQLSFTVLNTGRIDATLTGDSATSGTAVNGVKVATSSIDWAGTYTLAFTAPTLINLDHRLIPDGSGYASVKIAANGVMTITGKNADGTPLTASLASDSTASYRLYAKPNTNIGSYVAGWFTLSPRSGGGYHVDVSTNEDIYWGLAASSKNAAYKDGFGPLALSASMEPWANLFAPYQVSLADDGLFGVDIFGAGITNGGTNPNNLPTALQLILGGKISLTSPNLSGWSLTLNTSTGVFTGSFTVTETLTRKVSFGGVLLQLSDAGVFGQGYFLLPSTVKKGSPLSGGLEFIAPAPAP
jgi:hypothetical protein